MKQKRKGQKAFVLCAIAVSAIFICMLALKWDAIFQRGNPLPYLSAMIKLSGENTFEAVPNMDGIYVTRRGNKEELFQMVCDTYGVEFKEQFGSGYLFSDGEENYTIGSEIYWGRFTVWTLPFDSGV